jgi:methylglutamate dehydrogenase subunit C
MTGPTRIGPGTLIDDTRPVRFCFDGREYVGRHGDTLAAALLANGVRVVGRSFKYHRRRGVYTAGPEEPSALVTVVGANGREPNRPATVVPLSDGLVAESQNRWPSLRFDLLAGLGAVSRFLPAGFYYKTFMWPSFAWERLYEPLIRRAAGLGRVDPPHAAPTAAPPDTQHDHTDVLVVGAGAAGLTAAWALGQAGLRVILADQDRHLGGGTLLDPEWHAWRGAMIAQLAALPTVRVWPRTAVVGAYGHGVFGALETSESPTPGSRSERLHVIRAKSTVLATGSVERLIALPGNDVPGTMLAGAAQRYLVGHGICMGNRLALFTNNDDAYATALEYARRGLCIAAIIDVREYSPAADRARGAGLMVYAGAQVESIHGDHSVRAIRIRDRSGHRSTIDVDGVLLSGGHTPATALATQLGASLRWDSSIAAFIPDLAPQWGQVAGSAHGVSGLAAAVTDGLSAADQVLETLGIAPPALPDLPPAPADAPRGDLEPCWEVPGRGHAFVDLQHDVTTVDVRLARREGYEHVEHMKRYTTHGMATDQGRIGGLVGQAVLAAARGIEIAEVGQPRSRPFWEPVPFAALAGAETGDHFKPRRRLPLHDWHVAAGASFVTAGLWLRPLVYSKDTSWDAVMSEARHVRREAGITDVSSLGKIEIAGSDAAAFLDFVYANTLSTLAIGRCRYALMLREDGFAFDDGTVARLAKDHYILTTTTVNAASVLEHLEFHRQTVCPHWDVVICDVGDHWAQFAVAGPLSRVVLSEVIVDSDLSNDSVPFMAVTRVTIAGIPGRLFRLSFSGELAYEIAVPARHAVAVWTHLIERGSPLGLKPYGLDALNTLRIEKGHVTSAELNGQTTAADLGLARLCKSGKDYIGSVLSRRPSLQSGGSRLELVGVRPLDGEQRLRNGTHLLDPQAPDQSLGFITSSTPATEQVGWLGLALVSGGHARHGQRLVAVSPVHRERYDVEITSPHHVDPENARVRA